MEVSYFTDKYCFRSCANAKPSRVCGSDGKWYDNECELRKQNCDNGSKVEEVDKLNCEKSKLNWWPLTDR